jgi:hypothetical protein
MQKLDETSCQKALESGAFDLSSAAGPAALIMTQSWCPQWKAMLSYLPEAEKRLPGLSIFYVEYDTLPFFDQFRVFKETAFNNREIPYVRYYQDGTGTGESNYVSLEGFLHRLGET